MWLKELKTHANPDIKVFLIGNKIDLVESRKVTSEEAKKFKDDYMLNLYMETSAKTGFNAKEIFIEAARVLYKEYNQYKKVDEEKKITYSKTTKLQNSFQILVIGGKNTGKKTIIKSITGEDYNENKNKKTISMENHNISVEFILYDDNFNKNFKSISGVIFVYSIKYKNSFLALSKYLKV